MCLKCYPLFKDLFSLPLFNAGMHGYLHGRFKNTLFIILLFHYSCDIFHYSCDINVFNFNVEDSSKSLYFFISSFSYIQSQPLTLSYKPQSPWSLITIPPRVVGLKYFTWSEEPGRLQFTMLWRVGYDWATKSMHTHSLRTITQYSSSCVLDFQCYKTLNSSISNPSNLSFHSPNISIPLA